MSSTSPHFEREQIDDTRDAQQLVDEIRRAQQLPLSPPVQRLIEQAKAQQTE